MALDPPFDWSAAEAAINVWIRTATGLDLVWEDQNFPGHTLPFVTAKRIAGPVEEGNPVSPETVETEQQEILTFKILNTDAATYSVTLGGVVFNYTKIGGDTVTTIRNGLLTLVQAGQVALGVTAVASGTDSFTVTVNAAGDSIGWDNSPTASISGSETQLELARKYTRHKTATISIQAFTKDTDPLEILHKAIASLDFESTDEALGVAGLALRDYSEPQDISQLFATDIELRGVFTVSFSLLAQATEGFGIVKDAPVMYEEIV